MSDVQTAQAEQFQPALPFRNHTVIGVCEAIGEDFGFNPLFLRIPLAAGVLVSPVGVAAIYAALAVLVLASRLLFPAPRRPVARHADAAEQQQPAPARECQQELPLAA